MFAAVAAMAIGMPMPAARSFGAPVSCGIDSSSHDAAAAVGLPRTAFAEVTVARRATPPIGVPLPASLEYPRIESNGEQSAPPHRGGAFDDRSGARGYDATAPPLM
jgi:hypothetical protein